MPAGRMSDISWTSNAPSRAPRPMTSLLAWQRYPRWLTRTLPRRGGPGWDGPLISLGGLPRRWPRPRPTPAFSRTPGPSRPAGPPWPPRGGSSGGLVAGDMPEEKLPLHLERVVVGRVVRHPPPSVEEPDGLLDVGIPHGPGCLPGALGPAIEQPIRFL